MLVIPIFRVLLTKEAMCLKTPIWKNRKFWISLLTVIALLSVGIYLYKAFTAGSGPVSNKISKQEAQQIVDDTFGGIAKSTAKGADVIMDACTITVDSVEYGKNKDVILTCSYQALDVKGAMLPNLDTVMQEVYAFYQQNEDAGKKTNATKINLHIKSTIVEYL